MSRKIDAQIAGPNALRREYEGHDVRASGDGWIGNLTYDSGRESRGCVFGSGFTEQLPSATTVDVRAVNNNVSYAVLIR